MVESNLPGIWRYRQTFGLLDDSPVISLGEGNTPLVECQAFGYRVNFKLEFVNPSGSYKDRGSAVLTSLLKQRGIGEIVEDSSGNAGASIAAYAARAGIQAKIYVPDYASGPKLRQIEAYGAQVERVLGPRSNAAEAVRLSACQGAVYASHAYLPHGLAGYATIAFELFNQLGSAPGTIVAPVGQGSLLLGIWRGFEALQRGGMIHKLPVLVGVQACACAPLWAVFTYGPAGLGWVAEGSTVAEGVRVRYPVRGDALLEAVRSSGGFFLAVEEDEIHSGRDSLARLGLYVEPTSAIVWIALGQALARVPGPVIAILTGSGLKST